MREGINKNAALEAANNLLNPVMNARQINTIAKQTFPENSRDRDLTAPVILHLFIFTALLKDSLDRAIYEFNQIYSITSGKSQRYASKQAWGEARKRTPIEFLKRIFRSVVEKFCHSFDTCMRWKGFRVLSADGTCIDLAPSKELREIFRGPTNQNGYCKVQARMSCLVSVFTGLCIDFVVGTYNTAEMVLTNTLINSLKAMDLILLDRLYHCHGFLGAMSCKGRHFIVRGKLDIKPRVIKVLGDGDWLCEFRVKQEQRQKYKDAPPYFIARVIRFVPKGFRPVILITSLTDPEFATSLEIAELYTKRWRIEVVYRELKHTLNINNIRSQSAVQVHKEITAQMIANNLVRYAMQEAACKYGGEDKKLAVLYSFKEAYYVMKRIAQIAQGRKSADVKVLYEMLLQDIVTHKVVIRPGRHYPRPKKCTWHSKNPKGPDWMPIIVMVGINA